MFIKYEIFFLVFVLYFSKRRCSQIYFQIEDGHEAPKKLSTKKFKTFNKRIYD